MKLYIYKISELYGFFKFTVEAEKDGEFYIGDGKYFDTVDKLHESVVDVASGVGPYATSGTFRCVLLEENDIKAAEILKRANEEKIKIAKEKGDKAGVNVYKWITILKTIINENKEKNNDLAYEINIEDDDKKTDNILKKANEKILKQVYERSTDDLSNKMSTETDIELDY